MVSHGVTIALLLIHLSLPSCCPTLRIDGLCAFDETLCPTWIDRLQLTGASPSKVGRRDLGPGVLVAIMPVVAVGAANAITARAEPHVITQTIVKESTTFTTFVTLGGPIPTDYDGSKAEPDANIYGGTGDGDGDHGGLTKAQLGAIIGSSVALVIILLLAWAYVIRARSQASSTTSRRFRRGDDSSDSYDSSRSSSRSPGPGPRLRPPPPMRVRENIPGGPRYPTYRANPIPNPRRNPPVTRVV